MLKVSFEWKKQTVACMKLLIMVSKFLSCWSHHKLRLQRPMATRKHYRHSQYDSYDSLAQVCNWTNEDGESRQQTHYFHCDQIGIPREMTDEDGNLMWFGNHTS